jgi:hypothetical protein
MITLKLMNSETYLGSISEEELNQIVEVLEEENSADQNYYIDATTLDLMQQNRVSEPVVSLLRAALGDQEGIEIEWTRV